MRYLFEAQQWLPVPLEKAFSFFTDPENLPRLMPSWQQARIERLQLVAPDPVPDGLPSQTPIAGSGTRMQLSFRPFPLSPFRLRWEAEIQDLRWLESFTDVQLQGPFTYWKHRHAVSREVRSGIEGTLLADQVEYEPPFGLLGTLADKLFIGRQLRATFAHRQERTLELLVPRP